MHQAQKLLPVRDRSLNSSQKVFNAVKTISDQFPHQQPNKTGSKCLAATDWELASERAVTDSEERCGKYKQKIQFICLLLKEILRGKMRESTVRGIGARYCGGRKEDDKKKKAGQIRREKKNSESQQETKDDWL